MEQPRIAGVAGGVGTTTLASALRALDYNIYRANDPVDVLVARSTMYSLGCAQRAIAATPNPPILAVVAAIPNASLPHPVKVRLRMTEPHVAAVVMVPFVNDWLEVDDPHAEISDLLLPGFGPPPKSLRGFETAMRELVAQITPRLIHRSAAPPMPMPAALPSPPYSPDPVAAAWPSAR